jgi:polyisoprenyl-teichoic acid--peptidoglycan teichoic acid transferase
VRDFGEFTANTRGPAGHRRRAGSPWLMAFVLVLSAGVLLAAFATRELSGETGLASLSSGGAGSGNGAGDEASSRPPDGSEPVDILLVGLDGGEDAQGDGVQRADTLMLARLDPDTGEVRLLSIPRDLYVEDIGPEGEADRINSAYAYGGVAATVEAVEELAGVSVDHHVVADFEGFEEVVDALGGVEVHVEQDYLAHRSIPAGENVLDGKEALLYARYRKTPEGDLDRIQRQQQLLGALRSQMLSWESIGNGPGIVRSLDEHVETDMRVSQMVPLGRALAKGEEDGGLESAQLQGEPVTLPDGREVLEPSEERNEEILYEFLG